MALSSVGPAPCRLLATYTNGRRPDRHMRAKFSSPESISCAGTTRGPRTASIRENGRMTAAIAVAGLVKTFGSTRALDGLDLVVETGEVHGFLGPNGAGKSTTIRVLLGLLRADAGDVRLFGGDPWRQAAELHGRLAYVPGDVNLWPNLTGGEVIDLLGRLRGHF